MRIREFVPWTTAIIAVVAFGASFSELQRVRGRFGELSQSQARNHPHFDVRKFIIRAALQDAEKPIVVIGDSITEMGEIPGDDRR